MAVATSPVRDAQGSVVAASIVDRDLTESRWIATTLDDTLKTLEEALAEAQAAEATSRRFLADAAHQLRTPSPVSERRPRTCCSVLTAQTVTACSPTSSGRRPGPVGSSDRCCRSPALTRARCSSANPPT